MKLLIIFLVLAASSSKSLIRQSCTSSQILNTLTLRCVNCPPLMRPNPNQKIPTRCTCISGYYQNQYMKCVRWSKGGDCLRNQFLDVMEQNGMHTFPKEIQCSNCSINSFTNQYIICYQRNGTGCVSCPRYMIFNLSRNSCQCLDNTETISYLQTLHGCFNSTETQLTSSIRIADSIYFEHLQYLLPSCFYFKDLLACSFLLNLCIYSIGSGGSNQPWCQFSQQDIKFISYLQFDRTQIGFYMKPQSFNKQNQLSFKVLQYLSTGNLVKEKQMKFHDIFKCSGPTNLLNLLQIKNNRAVFCSLDVGSFVPKLQVNNSQNYLYEMFLMGQNNQYYPVAVYIGKNKTPVKRFFLKDSFSSSIFINILQSMQFILSIDERGNLISPCLYVEYRQQPMLDETIRLMTAVSQSSPSGQNSNQFQNDLETFWRVFISILITINVIVLFQSICRTYIAYLNRQSILGFFYYITNFWSLWMFYFLIGMSGYWFLLQKRKSQKQIDVSNISNNFAIAFYVIASLMGFFRIITIIYDKKQKLGYEKGKNSWREIFIINSLAEFYTYRTISFFWMLLWLLLFLVTVGWQQEAMEVVNGNNTPNRIFLYFLGAGVLLVIGIVFKILRRITVIVWPYPFEDFVDYCNVTNISFVFMKKRSLEAYYLHASIPDKSQVTYKQINDAIRRGLNKNRNIMKQHSFHQGQRMYIMYICKDLQEKFNNMLKRCEDEKEVKLSKHNKSKQDRKKNKFFTNPRQQFIQTKLKPYLDVIIREGSRNTKTFFNRFFGIPEVDFRDPAALRNSNYVIFDNNLDIVSEVFPNGNEFQQIHTLIIIFLMFLLMTANICASAILTYFVFEFMIDQWVGSSCREHLEAMTKVKMGFML